MRSDYVFASRERSEKAADELECVRQSQLWRTDQQRFLALEYVKAIIIDAAVPFNLVEHPRLSRFLSLMNPQFNVSGLNSKAVRMECRSRCSGRGCDVGDLTPTA